MRLPLLFPYLNNWSSRWIFLKVFYLKRVNYTLNSYDLFVNIICKHLGLLCLAWLAWSLPSSKSILLRVLLEFSFRFWKESQHIDLICTQFIFCQVTSSSNPSSDRPLAIIMAWLMSKDSHLKKFVRLYNDLGFDVLKCRISPFDLIRPTKGSQVSSFSCKYVNWTATSVSDLFDLHSSFK